MARTRRTLLGAVAGTLALAGCLGGDGDGDGDGSTAPPTQTTTPDATTAETTAMDGGGSATVQVRSHPEYGEILVDADGMTLYLFEQDERGAGASSCTGGCASAWPPLTADGDPTAGDAVTADLSTFERDDGSMQVAGNGWPLYYYASDAEPGDAGGQGVSDVWWVVAPDGTPVRSGGTETTSGTTTSGGGPGPY